jgi:glucokinase
MAAASLTVGIDLGGTKIQAAVLGGDRVLATDRRQTPRESPEAVVAAMAASAQAVLAQVKGRGRPSAVGVGSPGRIDAARGEVSHAANLPGFMEPVAVGPLLSKALGGVRVVLENDVRAAMLGEHRLGAGRPFTDVLGIFVGTGVGGGLVLGGTLREGRGAAGEIGHMVVKDGGRLCSCGRRGCLEAYAGRGCLEARAHRLVERGMKTVLFDLMQKQGRDRLTSGIWAAALKAGDAMAEGLIAKAAWALGLAIASAQNLLDLEGIIVGGGLGDRLGPPFLKQVEKSMQPHLFVPESPPQLLPSGLGDLSGAVGAALRASPSGPSMPI